MDHARERGPARPRLASAIDTALLEELAEPERACLAMYREGGWRAVQNAKGDWPTFLERERFLPLRLYAADSALKVW